MEHATHLERPSEWRCAAQPNQLYDSPVVFPDPVAVPILR